MSYSPANIEKMHVSLRAVLQDLQTLILNTVIEGQALEPASPVREHLLHGAARRLQTVKRALERVFELFPLDSARPLATDALSDVQTNLHAFVMNLYGLYDNWAWAFVLRHDLLSRLGDRRRVGLFLQSTQKFLPAELREHLTSEAMTRWHGEYAKSFRDALAHRIPPYVPPSEFTEQESHKFQELEHEKLQCIRQMRWDRMQEISEQQAALGRPCFGFMHSFQEDEAPRPILLHPQLLTDSITAVECAKLFFAHWHRTA